MISLFDILNSVDLDLEKNVKPDDNSFIDKFIDELKKYLTIEDLTKKFKNIPKDTLFTLDRYEGDYAVCENRTTGEMCDIPRLLVDPYAKDGDILRFENGKYQIDYDENLKQTEIIKELTRRINKSRNN